MSSLIKKLDDSLKSFQEGNLNASRKHLNAFSKEVRAHRNKEIERTAADQLIAYARGVTATIR